MEQISWKTSFSRCFNGRVFDSTILTTKLWGERNYSKEVLPPIPYVIGYKAVGNGREN
ncbi:hypothetical protein DU19_0662 [Chlamydia muridarum]|nr:hypothetical protein DU17_0664 [Chlamydia muridarum]KDU81613.1 hypothetical protein DU18_0661 [Chlamydia muridarum]KDU82017.1 hypothetical protein DU19_0662 [Chlamydia muridarum]KDU83569.1 hypothetical protein DU20_0663 [Chlamydia muridarum]KDU84842.1 hypothetical protein DU21_0664 [Chlamydia muridarum]